MPDTPVTSREVYQRLRDIAMGTCTPSVEHVAAGWLTVWVDGWRITLRRDGEGLEGCDACQAADGRCGAAVDWQRYGTDPVQLLSVWERERVERLLLGV